MSEEQTTTETQSTQAPTGDANGVQQETANDDGLVNQANRAADRLEDIYNKTSALLEKAALDKLSGEATGKIEEQKEEETAKDYAKKLMGTA